MIQFQAKGTFNLTKATKVSSHQLPYYNVETFAVPFTGEFDGPRIRNAMNRAFGAGRGNWGSAVGGFSSAQNVRDNGDGTFLFDQFYHLGD